MSSACSACRDGTRFAQPFSLAFQPIVHLRDRSVLAHEALVRGQGGEGDEGDEAEEPPAS